jgi:hypothetical protein
LAWFAVLVAAGQPSSYLASAGAAIPAHRNLKFVNDLAEIAD